MNAPADFPRSVRFGIYELDLRAGELRKNGVKLKLQEQPLQVLTMLLEHPGELVMREKFQQRLWPDTFVDFEHSLNAAVKRLRETLDDPAENPRFVETVPRRGYRFIAPLEGSSEPRAIPRETAKRRRTILIAAAAFLMSAAAAAFFSLHRGQGLTEKDTIVLADFTNTTGDAVFDGALKQALAVQLEQSPFLSLVSEERVQQTLRLMGRSADAKLTPEIARELCQRTESAAVLDGSIASLGSQYVLGLRAVNCRTGDALVEEQATADGKEQVLKALGQAAVKLREKFGESLSTVEKYDTPIEQATTPSLEALQAYSLGWKIEMGKADDTAAIPFYQRAIGLDPNFAMAYLGLATSYIVSEPNLAAESARKAYQLREGVSEREKFFIESVYHLWATGDLEKARQAFELEIAPRVVD